MSGKIQTATYKLDLDTSSLVQKFESAINEMKRAGANGRITDALSKELDQLKRKSDELTSIGKFGVEGSKGIQSFDSKVKKLYESYSVLGDKIKYASKNMSNFSSPNIGKLQKDIQELQKKVGTSFNKIKEELQKIGMDSSIVDEIKDKAKATSLLTDALKKEYDTRKAILKNIQDQIKKEKQLVLDKAGTGSKYTINSNNFAINPSLDKDIKTKGINTYNSALKEGLRQGLQMEELWKKIKQSLEDAGIPVKKLFSDIEVVKKSVEIALSDIEKSTPKTLKALTQAEVEAKEKLAQVTNSKGDNRKSASELIGKTAFSNAAEEEKKILQDIEQKKAELEAVIEAIKKKQEGLINTTNNLNDAVKEDSKNFSENSQAMNDSAKASEKLKGELNSIVSTATQMFSLTAIFNSIKTAIRATITDLTNLDKSFASIAMVTDKSLNEMWSTYSDYNSMAQQLGQTTDSVIKASALFYQQGLETNEALALTEDTMKLATLAGNDYATATQEMTAAIRGFKMEMEEGSHVTDVYSTLAASAAASVDDIAQAMSRTASIANSAGMSFENTSAFLAQMIETTQESAENIGTSLKTIIARFTELKENVAGTEDSEFDDLDYNKVDKALKSVGVSLKDTTGQFRNLDEVFLELSQKWDSLDRNTQRYVATIAAGSRQQSRFIAMMDNYERTAELMEIAADAEGKADEQFAKYADTVEYKVNQMKAKWEEFRTSLLNSEMFNGILDGINSLMNRLNNLNFKKILILGTLGFTVGKAFIGNFLKSINTVGSGLVKIGNTVGNKISSGIINTTDKLIKKASTSKLANALHIEPVIDDSVFNQKLQQLQSSLSKNELNIIANIDLSKVNNDDELLEKLAVAFRDVYDSESEAENAALRAAAALEQMGDSSQRVGQKALSGAQDIQQANLKREISTQRVNAASQALTQSLTLGITAFTAYATGAMSGKEALGMFYKGLVLSVAQIGIQTAATVASTTIQKAGWAGVFAAEMAALWPLLLITAAVAALVGIAYLIGKAIKENNKEIKTNQQLWEENAKAMEAAAKTSKSVAKQLEESSKEQQNNAKTMSETFDRYNELSDKGFLTDEESEEYTELINTILEDYPEVVSFYNEATGELTVQRNLMEEMVTSSKTIADNMSSFATQSEIDSLILNNEVTKNQDLTNLRNKIGLTESEIKSYSNSNKEVDFSNFFESIHQYDKEVQQSIINANKGNQDNINDALNQWEINKNNRDLQSIRNDYANRSDKGYGSEEIQKLDETMRQLYNSIDALSEEERNLLFENENIGINWDEDIIDEFSLNDLNFNQLLSLEGVATTINQKQNEAISENQKLAEERDRLLQESIQIQEEQLIALQNPEMSQGEVSLQAALYRQSENVVDIKSIASIVATEADEGDDNAIKMGTSFNNIDVIRGRDEDNIKEIEKALHLNEGEFDKDFIKEWIEIIAAKQGMTATAWFDSYDNEDSRWNAFISGVKEIKSDEEAEEKLKTLQSSKYYDELINATNAMQQNTTQQAIDYYNKVLDKIKEEELGIDTEDIRSYADDGKIEQYQKALEKATSAGLNSGIAEGMTTEQLNNYTNQIGRATKAGLKESEVESFFANLSALGIKEGLDKKELQELYNIDFENMDLSSLSTYKKKVQDIYTRAHDGSFDQTDYDKFWNNLINSGKQKNIINMAITDASSLEDLRDQITETFDSVVDGANNIQDVVETALTDGFINFSDYRKLEEELDKINLKIEDYTEASDEGFKLNVEELEDAYKKQISDQDYLLDQAKAAVQAGIDQLDNQIEELKGIQAQIEANKNNNNELQNTVTLTAAIAQNMASFTNGVDLTKVKTGDEISIFTINSSNLATTIDNLEQRKEELSKILNDEEALQAYIPYAESNAAWQEIINAFDETRKKVNDSTDKAKDKTDKLTEAQEKLNDALKEYNELLYGTENRKSGLDLLYNYEQAISDFNDEISRSKDLFDEASSIDEATDALQRYAEANHNLIAEEKAKQQVLESSLKNYEKQILTTVSYNNTETGENINIDFSNYVRKDNRTGLYVLDQQILDEAKFSDTWKEYLEEQVDAYNKYAEDLKKTDDEIRKVEKQMKELRETAVKNYAAMESEIADTLKAEYEKEVDNLKNKYDSMKEADDDYLDALQDAIQRQRDLRDQANAYEDLAEKEKKLSLMQRDTSGGNRVEVMQLEDEIQEDREQLLDDAIDNIIDGLSDLYESQEELRETEIELKEALLDNTAYWNARAESVATTFQSAEDYMAWMAEHSTEFAELTLTQQEQKLNEYGETFTAASQLMAINAMDAMSATGDYINEQMAIDANEVKDIVVNTGEALTNEATRVMNETKTEFMKDMDEAIKKIKEARDAVTEALEEIINAANQAQSNKSDEETKSPPKSFYSALTEAGIDHNGLDDISHKFEGKEEIQAMARTTYVSKTQLRLTPEIIQELTQAGLYVGRVGDEDKQSYRVFDNKKERDEWVDSFAQTTKEVHKYAQGGLVNYTGPAWVDGTPSRPEAFLDAEDTERIGNAARILANIPYLNSEQMTQNTENNINNSAETNIEVNLYIDNISSDVDMDNAIERMKQEITAAANPVGTVNILQKTI